MWLLNRLWLFELAHCGVLTEPFDKEYHFLFVHFKFFFAKVADVLRLLIQALLNKLQDLTLRSYDEIVKLPVTSILIATNRCVNLVIE